MIRPGGTDGVDPLQRRPAVFASFVDGALALKRKTMIRTRIRHRIQKFVAARYGLVKLENYYWDWRFGGFSGRTMAPRYLHMGFYGTRNTSYAPLEVLFARVPILEDDVLVDVGCGKGRVMNYWLRRGLRNRIVGLEIDPQVADWTRNRLKRYPNVTIVTGNAVENVPSNASLLYLYNPFDEKTMWAFKERLAQLRGSGKRLVVIYYAPKHGQVFRSDPQWEVERLDTGRFEPADLIRLRQ